MKLETFFEKFDQFADAPGAVAKMRELVLELAVQGKLVERKESDGNAATIFSGGLPPEAASRYEVAENWIWIRFAAVGEQRLGKMLDQKGNRGELKPYLRNTNVQWLRFQLDDIKELRLEPDELEEYRLLPGDLLICEGGEPGRCAIWRDPKREMYFQKAIHRVRPRKGILSEYLAICLQVDAQNGVLENHFTGATIKHFTGRALSEYSIPLPPLAEQKRIVAKVDELMALCDRLEAQQQERETRHAALARASLARFADAPTPANLPFLFHPSYAIPPADLRKSILTLAVQGKLVSFDAGDGEQTVGDHIEFQNGYAFKSEWFKPTGMRLCRNANVSHGVLDWRESAFVDDKVAKEFERFALNEGDIVLSLDRPLITTGLKVARIRESDLPCLLLQRVAKPVPKHDQLDMSYFLLWLNSSEFVDSIDPGRSNGVPHISTRQVQRLPFVLPLLAEQRRIVAKVEQLMALVDALETQLAASRATAANLLSALVAELTTQE